MPSHKQEIENVRRIVKVIGGDFTLHAQGARLNGTKGEPDCYIRIRASSRVRHNLRFHLEVKVGKDRLTPEQAAWKAEEEYHGGVVIVGGAMEVIAHMNPYLTTPIKVI